MDWPLHRCCWCQQTFVHGCLPAHSRPSSALLTVGTGIYFAAIRPAMMPEDERLTGVHVESLPLAFTGWLSIVFRTWAGFTIAFGVLLIAPGGFLRNGDSRWIRGGVATSVLIAFGSFLASNVQIGSDFVWFIALLFALAVCTAVAMLCTWTRTPQTDGHMRRCAQNVRRSLGARWSCAKSPAPALLVWHVA